MTTYKDAGVDVRTGEEFVRKISHIAKPGKGVIGGLGGFGALFDLKSRNYKDPILVSATDGVGTKLRIAIETSRYDTIGIDLVAMCVNDILAHGGEPIFFMDYYSCNKLDMEVGTQIIESIAEGCRLANCSLVGGETAEMPSFYRTDDFDLAGFAVGVVERDMLLPKKVEMESGDVLIGMASSGIHSNGFSLVRKIIEKEELNWGDEAPFWAGVNLGDALLDPTKIYVTPIMSSLKKFRGIKGLAHITGGGIGYNLQRILPEGMVAHVDSHSWDVPGVFDWLSKFVDQDEMLRVFNCGLGMIMVVEKNQAASVLGHLNRTGHQSFTIGELKMSQNNPVIFHGNLF